MLCTSWSLIAGLFLCPSHQASAEVWPLKVSPTKPSDVYVENNIKKVAIIGAGAGGASTAYHLQKFAADTDLNINITVFDRASYIGGRTTTVNAYNNPLEPVELGASIFVEVNAILKNSSDSFGLRIKQTQQADDQEFLGIWNGREFVYTQKGISWKYWDLAKLLWRYGLAPFRTQKLMQTTVSNFLKLYKAPFFPFKSLTETIKDLDLLTALSVTGEHLLDIHNIRAPFTTDIIQASTRVNYGQNLDSIHGLEAMVCMAIEGAMQIEGGNWQIFDKMLKAANSTVLLDTVVNSVSKIGGRFRITSSSLAHAASDLLVKDELFDTVVLAAPFQFSNIVFEDGLLDKKPDVIPYVKLHVTLFSSPHNLNPEFFNVSKADMPSTILTTLPPNEGPGNKDDIVGPAGFFSISTLRTILNPNTGEKEYLYKIFSPEKINSAFLSGILGSPVPEDPNSVNTSNGHAISWYYAHVWQSYPYEYPRVTFEDTELARDFYYTSGIESFISTMETSALMGMNVAQLIMDDYLQIVQSQQENKEHDLLHVEEL